MNPAGSASGLAHGPVPEKAAIFPLAAHINMKGHPVNTEEAPFIYALPEKQMVVMKINMESGIHGSWVL